MGLPILRAATSGRPYISEKSMTIHALRDHASGFESFVKSPQEAKKEL
jgi:hypothetical protein